VPVAVEKKTWLSDLVDDALAGYDPAAAMMRLPPELRGADPDGPGIEARARALMVRSLRARQLLDASVGDAEAFLAPVRGHVELVLDIALLHGGAFDAGRRKAELAALLAAAVGAVDLARDALPGRPGTGTLPAVRKALLRAGARLRERGHPPGDPKEGLPLRAGVLCIERRHLARLAIAYYGQGQLDLAGARRMLDQANEEASLLVEALAGIAGAPEPLDARRRHATLAQTARLGLPRDLARRTRRAVRAPRGAAELARAAPVRMRAFLVEQLFLSELASAQSTPARAAFLDAFVEEARIPPEQVAALQADAADLYAGQQRWVETSPRAPGDWEALSDEWDEVADQMMEKLATVVTDNLEAIVTEAKLTGALGQLLAKSAAGKTLTLEEKRKVKRALIDLAKAVPALAIFAAPGGMLLLPLLAKVLPFNVLPSAWDARAKPGAELKRLPGKKVEG
jgi:LETM1-like protein